MSEHVLDSGLIVPRLEMPRAKSVRDLLEGVRGKLRGIGFMMAGFSDAQELAVLDSVFGDGATNLNTAPTYLALCTAAVGETDTGATLVEATYTGYARKALAAADLSAAAAGAKTNSAVQTFAACSGGSSTVTNWAVCTTSGTGTGEVVVFGTCTSTTISTTQTPASVAASGLNVTLD